MTRMMIMAGGTGGHVMPALAVAKALIDKGVDINWIGTSQGIEARMVPESGIAFDSIDIKGLRSGGLLRKTMVLLLLIKAMAQTFRLIRKYKPEAVLGMGGFVSGPGGLTAAALRLPVLLHEQNMVAGLTNRWLARFSQSVLTGFPQAQGIKNFTWVGNPVRQDITEIPAPEQRLANRTGALRILVTGGSQGAYVFNQELPGLLKSGRLPELDIWHQSGQQATGEVSKAYLKAGIGCRVDPFINDMAMAYEWCDIIICRSGAMTVSEICCAGVVAIFVPYPHAVSDHQAVNADFLVRNNAAFVVREESFVEGEWLEILSDLERDHSKLVAMGNAARRLSKPRATQDVASRCMEALHA